MPLAAPQQPDLRQAGPASRLRTSEPTTAHVNESRSSPMGSPRPAEPAAAWRPRAHRASSTPSAVGGVRFAACLTPLVKPLIAIAAVLLVTARDAAFRRCGGRCTRMLVPGLTVLKRAASALVVVSAARLMVVSFAEMGSVAARAVVCAVGPRATGTVGVATRAVPTRRPQPASATGGLR